MEITHKLVAVLYALAAFAVVMGLVVGLASWSERRRPRAVAWLFLAPTFVLVAVGLVWPALRTVWLSFFGPDGSGFVGLRNYGTIFTSSQDLLILRNTVLWTLVTPFVATAVGLLYAVLVDGARGEALSKALIFLPMAISLVGASIIWKFMYDYKSLDAGTRAHPPEQIGLINQVIVWLGGKPYDFLLHGPWNTFFLIAVMIWIQAGFAMTILSASIKAIPADVVEAARLDGVSRVQMFRFVTLPTIRPAVVVVLTTIAIACLKVFDIVRTMTGGNFGTDVIANEFFTQSFSASNYGIGAALAVLLFVLVVPIVVYNVRQMRASEAR